MRWVALAGAWILAANSWAAGLPVPCQASGNCGSAVGSPYFATYGSARWAQSGSKLTVTQTSSSALLNWQSFNIAAGNTVQFVQPSSTSVALNKIVLSNPSSIFGALNANGQIFLINPNGIIFGSTAQVNVGSLVASTLDVTPSQEQLVLTNGLTAPLTQNGQPAFSQGSSSAAGALTVQPGASIQTSGEGTILLFAPTVTNEGTLQAPQGQVMLAAGTEVYLAASNDPDLRGLLVEVDNAAAPTTTPTVTNGAAGNAAARSPAQLVGQIIADEGNVTLAGLAVNQLGRVSATTSVRENGSIVLQARSGSVTGSPGEYTLGPLTGGDLTLGPQSDTAVTLDTASTETTVDSVAQPKSTVAMTAANVQVQNGATVTATSGSIGVTALVNQAYNNLGPNQVGETAQSDGSSIYIAPDATLDVSGASVTLPASSLVIPVELRGTEFANFPLQRDGPLRGATVYVDSLLYGARADGSLWVGTPVGDVSGEVAAIPRNVAERNLTGGTISLQSQGDVVVAPGATLDVAGGAIHYTAGYLNTTQLVTTGGTLVNISQADPDQLYTGIASPTTTVSDPKWGVTTTYANPGSAGYDYQPAFVEGMNAGTVTLLTPRFVLDGTIDGQVTVGQYQRLPQQPSADWALNALTGQSSELYQPYDQVPLPGTLIVGEAVPLVTSQSGPELLSGNVIFANETVLPELTAGGGFNPATDPLPASYTASVLRPELFGAQGIGNLKIYSDDSVTLPAGVHLEIPTGGGLAITANTVDVQGSVDAPGGTISMDAESTAPSPYPLTAEELPSIDIGAGAGLIARGAWVNDSVELNPNGPSGPLFLNGGSVSLGVSSGDLTLAAGSLIDVSGGAQLTVGGTLNFGTAGTISLGVTPYVVPTSEPGATQILPTTLVVGGTLRGYGVREGGSLALTADTVCVAVSDCAAGDSSVLWLTPDFFQRGGFSSYDVSSSLGGLTVAPGAVISLVQQNLTTPLDLDSIASAAAYEPLASPTLLPSVLRQPTNLELNAEIVSPSQAEAQLDAQQVQQLPSLQIGTGAVISADPQASITLISDTRVIDDGTIDAPAGNVRMLVNNNLQDLTAIAPPTATLPTTGQPLQDTTAQGIWLGPAATVDAQGVAQIVPNDSGISTGTVFPGGTVSLVADRGYVELLPGSVIDVSGTATLLTQLEIVGGGMRPVTSTVATAGGSISLEASTGISAGGTLLAAPGAGAARTPAGGSLQVWLDPELASYPAPLSPGTVPFELGPGNLLLEQNAAPDVVAPGSPVPESLFGEAIVSAAALNESGFSSETLQSGVGAGVVTMPQNLLLQTDDSIDLDAGAISLSPGVAARLSAPYVSIGNTDVGLLPSMGNPSAGTGTLYITGTQMLDVFGSLTLEGVASTYLQATNGDIRLQGIVPYIATNPVPTNPAGQLLSAGNIELQAVQIYPATLTQFTIASTAANGLIDVEPSSTSAAPDSVWSAGGALTLSAAAITQNGTLRAPFGTITLEGPATNVSSGTIELGAGSLTSTSADGLTIPFGTTQGAGTATGAFAWTYPVQQAGGTSTLYFVYGAGGVAPPSQQINLIGSNVAIDGAKDGKSAATVDMAGGGDLMAYEFLPDTTTGGTEDVLGATTGLYAILPSLNSSVAPYDPNISNGSTLALGQSLYLAGAPGLPAGTYTLLPARYALLPGAFLVEPAGAAYNGITPGEQFANPGGGTIVAGYNAVAATSIADSNTSGFAVIPASVFDQQATYATTLASQFFPSQAQSTAQTQGAPVATPRLPADAGVLTLAATNQLTLSGNVLASPASGGLGAQVNIASANIDVVPASSAAATPGVIALTAASLEQLGAQSLLLGGERSGSTIETFAQSVTIDAGVQLSAPEILVAATDQITVSTGATLSASGAAPPPSSYTVSVPSQVAGTGDGAFLSLSTSPIGTLTRVNATADTGTLDLQAGSTLKASGGSAYLDGAAVLTDGTLALSGGDLAVQSSAITLGVAASGNGGSPVTVLGDGVLSAAALRSLTLVSGSSIGIGGSVTVSAQNLTLDSPGLVAAQPDATATMTASNTLELTNSANGSSAAASVSGGSLTLNAQDIELGSAASSGSAAAGPVSVTLSGFATVALGAQGELAASTDASLAAASGNLTVTAARLTTQTDASLSITAANGSLMLTAPSSAAIMAPVTSLGGSLQLTGQSVELNTSLALPAGSVRIASTGGAGGSDVTLDSGAVIDVAGALRTYDGIDVAAPAGSVAITSQGNVSFAPGSVIDVSGAPGGEAGSLAIVAPNGSFVAGGTLKGASGAGQGGSFSLEAGAIDNTQGTADFAGLIQTLATAGFNGTLAVELHGPGDLDVAPGTQIVADNLSLVADQGSVTIGGTLNVSGTAGGTVLLAASNQITLAGTSFIDAEASGAGQSGGQVVLEAGTYTFDGSGALQSSPTAGIAFEPGATIEVGGGPVNTYGNTGSGGGVLARVPAAVASANGVLWQGSVLGAGPNDTILEAVIEPTTANGMITSSVTSANESSAIAAATDFMSGSAASILANLNLPAGSSLMLEPGLEFDNPSGSLTVSSAWNLYPDRFDGVPGVLTLRASGGVTFAPGASLSDGFTTPTSAALQATDSWSYRVVAGADFSSANVMTVLPESSASAPADVTIQSSTASSTGTVVRTGTGSIDVAASGDFVLSTPLSVLYTAGTVDSADPGLVVSYGTNTGGSLRLQYPTDGGNVSISAGGNIDGSASGEFVTGWLWRIGTPGTGIETPHSTSWSVAFPDFQDGIGALGGGDVTITAGGNITDLSVSIPSIGKQNQSNAYDPGAPLGGVDVIGVGSLTVQAGGSIAGGTYYVGLGTARISAGGDVSATGSPSAEAPVLALGDAQVTVQAGGNIVLGGIVNPTLAPTSIAEAGYTSFFDTYTPDTAVNLVSTSGDITLEGNPQTTTYFQGLHPWNPAGYPVTAVDLLPPTVSAVALDGDITFGGLLALLPAPKGNLELLAQDSILAAPSAGTGPATLIVSDADPQLLPSIQAPSGDSLATFQYLVTQSEQFFPSGPSSVVVGSISPDAPVPVHTGDTTPVEIVAADGNIDFSAGGGESGIITPKPARVIAGGDIIDLGLIAQNLLPSDVTVVSAGGSITYPFSRIPSGYLNPNTEEIAVDGPGALEVSAGGTLDLGTSNGIVTRGNLVNPFLPATGADVTITVGTGANVAELSGFLKLVSDSDDFDAQVVSYVASLTGDASLSIAQAKQALDQLPQSEQLAFMQYALAPQYGAAISKYIDGSSTYDSMLTAYVEQVTGESYTSAGAAKQAFQGLPAALQDLFVDQVVLTEMNTDATQAVKSGSNDYSGAFAALTTLFPGANPDLASGQSVPYQGDVDMYFSQIYTLGGGSITLLAPGGEIDVGLATPPTAFGLSKGASNLGMVAQGPGNVSSVSYGDFTVNESRVFAADGGNILAWSTDGNIDAGRGAKSSISAPPPTITIGPNGQPIVSFPPALTGSGIQALADEPGVVPGTVSLFAPHGVVNANDAGIVAGNLTIGATAVLGANNITVTGTAIGLPVVVTGVGASLAAASGTASAASNAAQEAVQGPQTAQNETPVSSAALGFLDVFVTGLGEENCKPEDNACLQREQKKK